jgi:hypothetical protein
MRSTYEGRCWYGDNLLTAFNILDDYPADVLINGIHSLTLCEDKPTTDPFLNLEIEPQAW